MINPPSRGKPQDPRNEDQVQPGPLVQDPTFPQISMQGSEDIKRRAKAGKYSGKIIRAGRSTSK